MKILVMGLSRSGKTTLCKALLPLLDAVQPDNNAANGVADENANDTAK